MTQHLYLVRHGETEWSRSHRHTSFTDVPLTEGGRKQARAIGRRLSDLDFSLVLCSPLLRARETCEIAGLIESAQFNDDLREWNYGQFEGLTTREIRRRIPGWTVWTHGPAGGETAEDVRIRVDRVIELAGSHEGNVVVFAHGHLLRALAARWIGIGVADGSRLSLDTGTVSEMGYEREQRVILRWNTWAAT
jgi:broad specificity phosphatase PhoE